MDKGGKDKEIDDDAQDREMILTDSMCQEKEEEEDSPTLEIAGMYLYEDSKTTVTKVKKD